MIKQIVKYTLSLILTALIMLSGSYGVFKHLACNHCDVASLFNSEQAKGKPMACCSTNSLGINTLSLDDCFCDSDSDSQEETKRSIQTTVSSKLSVDLIKVPVMSLISMLLSIDIKPIYPKPISSRIASGRDILAMNAVLII
ncbi:MAG: hypothetical protein ACRC6R_01625 [Bacteroidales bacterium]